MFMGINDVFKINPNNNRHYEKYDKPKLSLEISNLQIKTDKIKSFLSQPYINEILTRIENEIKIEHIGDSSNVFHGAHHIEDVVLFSLLIGTMERLNHDDIQLLLKAAKYHDIGREIVGEEQIPHADAGAVIVKDILKNTPAKDVNVIQTAIAFHEVPRKENSNDDVLFKIVAHKYGIADSEITRVKRISEILKDADALDRTRLSGHGRTDVKLFSTESAKYLVKFAAELQEQYALDILFSVHVSGLNDLLQVMTPQEILFELKNMNDVIKDKSKEELLKQYIDCVKHNEHPYDKKIFNEIKNQRKLQHLLIRNKNRVNILLIGFGPHARRIHFPILQSDGDKVNAEIKAIIDIESASEPITNYLEKNNFNPQKVIFLNSNETCITNNELSPQLIKRLNQIVRDENINAVFVCTEPSAHVAYGKWALKNGLNVLMDKPVSAPRDLSIDMHAVNAIESDYQELLKLYLEQKKYKPNLVFEVMAQRRYHPAFHKLKNLIEEVNSRTGVPVTSFQTTHNDGQWRMPSEIVDQNYHPYNQGYGKLLHSGYHAIDIMTWLTRNSIKDSLQKPSKIEVFSNFSYPNDFITQLPLKNYTSLFGLDNHQRYSLNELNSKFEKYGEIDAQIGIDVRNKDGRNITLGQFNLEHNSFSQRNWFSTEGRDLYKGNGRIRHESHRIDQGPFQTILYHSFQSEEILNDKTNHSDVGGEYNLDIHVFRNSKMFPDWVSYEKITIDDLGSSFLRGYSRGHQEDARRAAILTFIKSVNDSRIVRFSDLEDQQETIGILKAAYESAYRRKQQENPLVTVEVQR